jgi:hypothetical protein
VLVLKLLGGEAAAQEGVRLAVYRYKTFGRR